MKPNVFSLCLSASVVKIVFFHRFSRPCRGMAKIRSDASDRDGHGTTLVAAPPHCVIS
jgi:hypothetical protein